MSLTELSVENGLCRCCLAEGDFKNLGHTFIINEEEEVYSRMLRECFGITINPVAGEYSQSTYSICEKCLKTLREANIFKKMVIESEIKFQHLLSTSFIKDLKPIKVELDEVIISADENKDDNNGGVRDTHIDDDDFRYPCSDEDDKSTLELKLELEPTSKKPKTEVKKDTQPYKTKLRKKKTTKESASVPQKKTRKGRKTADYYTKTVDAGTGVATFNCAECTKSFNGYRGVHQHYHCVHLKERKSTRKCHVCFISVNINRRALHMEEAHGVERPKCNSCGKKFNFMNRLNAHQRIAHMGEKNHKCSFCGREFFFKYRLERHMVLHSGVKDYKCEQCGKAFTWVHNLQAHLKTHVGAKPFVCDVCDAAYTEKRSLRHHIERNHCSKAQLKVYFKT